jgi:putative two-component system response regulator
VDSQISIGDIDFNGGAANGEGLRLLRSEGRGDQRSTGKSTILVADGSLFRRHSIISALHELGLDAVEARSTSEAMDELGQRRIDTVLVDLFVPGSGAIDFCRRVRATTDIERVPILVLTREDDADNEVLAMEAGADEFLVGPLRPRVLRARVQSLLRRKSLMDSLDETETVVFTLARSVEERDPALGQHCERLALMAAAMGVRLGLPPSDILALQRGGYLHDVGKVGIPDNVLMKPGPLTPEEWVVMKTHAEKGERICKEVRSLAPVLPIIRHHHERWDGSGYPDKLRGPEIPLLARILQMADIYDALTAARPYKRAFTSDEAIQIMRDEAAKGWRDPELIGVFEDVLPAFRTSQEDSTAASLNALAESIEKYRKNPGRSGFREMHAAESPVRLVSGL